MGANIIAFLVELALALIPANIADKKGYSKGGFYCYGLFLFLPALIHSAALPDRLDSNKKQYTGNTLSYAIMAAIFLYYEFFVGLMKSVMPYYDFGEIVSLKSAAALLLVIGAILGRQYIVSIIAYVASAVLYGYDIISQIGYMNREGNTKYLTIFYIPSIIGTIALVLSFVTLAYIAYKYGVKGRVSNGPKFVFALPALLYAVNAICVFVIYASGLHGSIVSVVFEVASLFLGFVGILFLGLFYGEDSKPQVVNNAVMAG